MIDKIYIDPIYTRAASQPYYSNDTTVGERRLSPISPAA